MENQTIEDNNATKKEFNNIEYQKEYYKKNKDKLLTKLKEKTKVKKELEDLKNSFSFSLFIHEVEFFMLMTQRQQPLKLNIRLLSEFSKEKKFQSTIGKVYDISFFLDDQLKY